MRILKFIGAFLGTLLIVFLIVFGFNMDVLMTMFRNHKGLQEGQEWVKKTYSLKGLTEYIGAQPQQVSVVSLSADNPDSSILYNEHTPRTMGRLSNFFLVVEYVKEVQSGKLNPNQQVKLDEVNKFQLPFIDASNHDDALGFLEDQGRISNERTIALADIVQMAVEYSDLAASDYLYFRIDPKRIDRLMDQLSIEETEPLLPFCGLYIALTPSVYGTDFEQRADSLSNMGRPEFEDLVIKTARRFARDNAFRERIKQLFTDNEGLGITFIQQRNSLDFFPKTTASEMANLMRKVQKGTLLSQKISRQVKQILSWPLRTGRLTKDFKTYCALYDSRMGVVNGMDFGTSTYTGKPYAQAVFFDNLPVAFWFHMSSNLMHQDFEQRLIWDPGLRKATIQEISKKE